MTLANIVSAVCYLAVFLYAVPAVKLWVKNWITGHLTFSDSLSLEEGAVGKIVPN